MYRDNARDLLQDALAKIEAEGAAPRATPPGQFDQEADALLVRLRATPLSELRP